MEMKLIAENEICWFYNNDSCASLTDYCERPLYDLKPLKNHKVFICKEKANNNKCFVLFTEKGQPIAEASSLEAMAVKIETIRHLESSKKEV